MAKLMIIGAGVAGLTVATQLLRGGHEVHVCDPGGEPGPHSCSWWAGGMLAPWCEYESAELPVVRFGQIAADWWSTVTNVTHEGTLLVAHRRDRGELRRFSQATGGWQVVNTEQIAELEPDLSSYASGLFFPDEAHLAPRVALADLYRGLCDKGVIVDTAAAPTAPEDLRPGGGFIPADIDLVVDCRGLAARDQVPQLRGVKGEMLVVSCPEVELRRPVRLLHPRIPLYVVPRGGGVYMIGATMVENSDRSRISARSMLELLSGAYALTPAFGEAEVTEIGVDARPALPTHLPRVTAHDHVIYANGLYRHGFLLSPALATATARLADSVLGGDITIDGPGHQQWELADLLPDIPDVATPRR